MNELYQHKNQIQNQKKWDKRFLGVCDQISMWSSCLSRQIGAILVRDRTIIATGYNGPPRGIPHCGKERSKLDSTLFDELRQNPKLFGDHTMCPRQRLGYGSGEGLHLCPAAHAEENCIINAARIGVMVKDSTMYMNCPIPCKECLKKIINAGIAEIVCIKMDPYDNLSTFLLEWSEIKIRTYEE